MLQFFRTNQFFANILLLFYALALKLYIFFVPTTEYITSKGVLANLTEQIVPTTGIGSEVFSMFLILLQAIILNYLVSQYRIGKEVTLFAGMIYILLALGIPGLAHWSPVLLANTFFIMAIVNLFAAYKKSSVMGSIFNVGFWTAVASLFYFSFIWFFIMVFIGLGVLRSFRFKEQLTVLIGFLIPYFLTAVGFFCFSRLSDFWQQQFTSNLGFLHFQQAEDYMTFVKLGLVLLLVLISLFSYGSYMQKQNIQVQKKIDVLFWAMLFAGLTIFFQQQVHLSHLLLIAPSLAIFISLNLLSLNNRPAELAHLFLLFIMLYFQYGILM